MSLLQIILDKVRILEEILCIHDRKFPVLGLFYKESKRSLFLEVAYSEQR